MLQLMLAAVAGIGFALAPGQTRLQIDAAPIERTLTFAQPDEYTAELRGGEFYSVTAFQENVDLVLEVYGPDGKQLAAVDSPNGTHGPEEWDAVAPAGGPYRFLIRGLDKTAPGGKYTMAIRSAGPYFRAWIDEHVESPRIRQLWKDSMGDPRAVDAFLAERKGKGPLIERNDKERSRVTFVYMGTPDVSNVKLYGGPSTEWETAMNRLGRTDLWFVSFNVPLDSRFNYGFEVTSAIHGGGTAIPNETFTQDPLNPVRASGATATSARSILALDGAPKQPFSIKPPAGEPRGALIPSKISLARFSRRTEPIVSTSRRDSIHIGTVLMGSISNSTARIMGPLHSTQPRSQRPRFSTIPSPPAHSSPSSWFWSTPWANVRETFHATARSPTFWRASFFPQFGQTTLLLLFRQVA